MSNILSAAFLTWRGRAVGDNARDERRERKREREMEGVS